MALQPSSPQFNVPRPDVSNVVDAMLLDSQVKWIGMHRRWGGSIHRHALRCGSDVGASGWQLSLILAYPTKELDGRRRERAEFLFANVFPPRSPPAD